MTIYSKEEILAYTNSKLAELVTIPVKIVFNNRIKKCLARVAFTKSGYKSDMELHISTYHLNRESSERMQLVILHEIAHIIDVEQRGTSDHSNTWKKIAIKIGAEPSYKFKTLQ